MADQDDVLNAILSEVRGMRQDLTALRELGIYFRDQLERSQKAMRQAMKDQDDLIHRQMTLGRDVPRGY